MRYPRAAWRLILSPPADGAANMAADEAMLLSAADGAAPPTLRFFAWDPPCLSLGYAQPASDADLDRLRALGWDLVRRPTGGRAILHADELTYSIAAPASEPRVAGGVVESYRRLAAGLLAGLHALGAAAGTTGASPGDGRDPANPVCFEVPSTYEITVNGRKLVGSAQVRKRGAVLQHGSLPLAGDLGRICWALPYGSEAERRAAADRVRRRACTLSEALEREVSWLDAARSIAAAFARAMNLELAEGEFTAEEVRAAAELRAAKYAAERWTLRGAMALPSRSQRQPL